MKMTKKLLCLLLAMMLTLSLCACGADNTDREDEDDDGDGYLASLKDEEEDTKREHGTATVTTAPRVPALQRGNKIGNVCYDAQLPLITAEGIQEETVDPTAFGKVTVINFWYTACSPAVAEMPYFDSVAKKYGEDIQVVAVHGMFPNTAPSYIAQNYASSPIVFLSDYIPEGQTDELNRIGYFTQLGGANNAYPRTIILNEKGIITEIFSGTITERELETAVLEAMGRM